MEYFKKNIWQKIKVFLVDSPIKLSYYHHGLIFLVAMGLIFSRRPDVLLNPQFWAEDGAIWFANAYNNGIWQPLLIHHTGYYQTFSRLCGSLSQFLPLAYGPLFFNLMAITVKILPINFLFSKRFNNLCPRLIDKIVLSLVYIGLPNSGEVFANVTNSHWHLALLAFMVIVAKPAQKNREYIFDSIVLLLSGLSGPFILILFPLAMVYFWRRSAFKSRLFSTILLLIPFVVQIITIIFNNTQERVSANLGASIGLFLKIISGKIIIESVVGLKKYGWLINNNMFSTTYAGLIFLIAVIIIIYVFLKTTLELKLFLVFSALILAMSLISPMISTIKPQWTIMWPPGTGARYFFIPSIAWLVSIFWAIKNSKNVVIRIIACLMVVVLPFGLFINWQLPAWRDLGYKKQVEEFQQISINQLYKFNIYPPGWGMTLKKH